MSKQTKVVSFRLPVEKLAKFKTKVADIIGNLDHKEKPVNIPVNKSKQAVNSSKSVNKPYREALPIEKAEFGENVDPEKLDKLRRHYGLKVPGEDS